MAIVGENCDFNRIMNQIQYKRFIGLEYLIFVNWNFSENFDRMNPFMRIKECDTSILLTWKLYQNDRQNFILIYSLIAVQK